MTPTSHTPEPAHRTRVRWLVACAALAVMPRLAVAQSSAAASLEAAGDRAAPAATLPFAAPPAQAQWIWPVDEGAPVVLRGAVLRDAAGGKQGQMMYPAPDPLTFLVAIATHAAITGMARNAEEQQLLDAAAMRSKYYREAAETISLRDLQSQALRNRPALSVAPSAPPGGSGMHRVELAPVFVMAVDARSLALEATVRLTRAGGAPQDKTVRVVSAGPGAAYTETYWLADNGLRLKDTMATLLAEAIDLAIDEPSLASEPRQKTVRYLEGQDERIERGYLLGERCGRAVVRSLRGVLMSLPLASAGAADTSGKCPQTVQDPAGPPMPAPAAAQPSTPAPAAAAG